MRHRCAQYSTRKDVTKHHICHITCENIEVYLSFSKPVQIQKGNGQKLFSEYQFKRQEMAYAGRCRNFLPFLSDFLFHVNKIPSDLLNCLTFKC